MAGATGKKLSAEEARAKYGGSISFVIGPKKEPSSSGKKQLTPEEVEEAFVRQARRHGAEQKRPKSSSTDSSD